MPGPARHRVPGTAKRNMPKARFDDLPHTHVAFDDAIGQGVSSQLSEEGFLTRCLVLDAPAGGGWNVSRQNRCWQAEQRIGNRNSGRTKYRTKPDRDRHRVVPRHRGHARTDPNTGRALRVVCESAIRICKTAQVAGLGGEWRGGSRYEPSRNSYIRDGIDGVKGGDFFLRHTDELRSYQLICFHSVRRFGTVSRSRTNPGVSGNLPPVHRRPGRRPCPAISPPP